VRDLARKTDGDADEADADEVDEADADDADEADADEVNEADADEVDEADEADADEADEADGDADDAADEAANDEWERPCRQRARLADCQLEDSEGKKSSHRGQRGQRQGRAAGRREPARTREKTVGCGRGKVPASWRVLV